LQQCRFTSDTRSKVILFARFDRDTARCPREQYPLSIAYFCSLKKSVVTGEAQGYSKSEHTCVRESGNKQAAHYSILHLTQHHQRKHCPPLFQKSHEERTRTTFLKVEARKGLGSNTHAMSWYATYESTSLYGPLSNSTRWFVHSSFKVTRCPARAAMTSCAV
jgi:hypothetical protein